MSDDANQMSQNSYPNAGLKRLLSKEQLSMIDAFPAPGVIKSRSAPGGSSVAFLQKEYIIDTLGQIFGVEYVSISASEMAVIDKGPTKTKKYDEVKRERVTLDAFHATFSCKVTLKIGIPDESGKIIHRMIYSAYGTDSQVMAEREGILPITETIEMASKGANTNALKRAAQQIGRVFGLDLSEAPREGGSKSGAASYAKGSTLSQRMGLEDPGKPPAPKAAGNGGPDTSPAPAEPLAASRNADPRSRPQPDQDSNGRSGGQGGPDASSAGPDLTGITTDATPILSISVPSRKEQPEWQSWFSRLARAVNTDGRLGVAKVLAEVQPRFESETASNKRVLTKWSHALAKNLIDDGTTMNDLDIEETKEVLTKASLLH